MKKKNNSEPVKKNQSSVQVLKTLIKLMEDNYTMSELVEELNRDEPEPVFNNSIISKYINTCRYCGIKIHKIHNKYVITKTPFGIDITDSDYELIKLLQDKTQDILSMRAYKRLNEFINKLSRFFNRNVIKIDDEELSLIEDVYIKAANDERKVRLIFKTQNDMDCCPISIIDKDNKKYFKVLYNNQEKLISFDRIANIELLHEKYKFDKFGEEVVFKLTGGLAARYEIRPNEKIVKDNLPDSIVISNKGEDRETLISRLMRYDSLCEIDKPASLRNEMKKIINEMLANYGE